MRREIRGDMSGRPSSGVSGRAVLTGSLLVGAISVVSPWAILIVKGSQLAGNAVPIIAVFFLFGLAAAVVPALKLIGPRLSLCRAELVTVYIMMLVGSVIVTVGFSGSFLTVTTGVIYYATPENMWGELFVSNLHEWLAPADRDAVRWFYEGLPEGVSIPWAAWARPLAAWVLFILAFYWVLFCTGVLLRGQWVENERLAFPLTRLPLAMIEDADDRSRLIGRLFKRPLLWVGFLIPFLFHSWNSLGAYFDGFPRMAVGGAYPLLNGEVMIQYRLNLPVIGLAYLMPLDVSFSIWFFHLLGLTQEWVLKRLGIGVAGMGLDVWDSGGSPVSMLHEQAGALAVLCLFVLWTARGHLKKLFGAAVRGERREREPISPRVAIAGLVLGLSMMVGWLTTTGLLSLLVAILLVGGALVVFIGLSRIVCEAGLPSLQSPMVPQAFITRGFGPDTLQLQNMTGLGLATVWIGDTITNMMNAVMHSLKLTSTQDKADRRLVLAMLLAVAIALTGSLWCIMTLAYAHGGINLQGYWFELLPKWPFDYMASAYNSPEPSFTPRLLFTAIGAGVMWGLLYLKGRFMWWPLNPIGFPIAKTVTIVYWNGLAIFTAWILKAIILRYGGIRLYRSLIPFFLGLILGEFSTACGWAFIDGLNGVEGNIIFRN